MSVMYAPAALRVPKGFEHLLEGFCTEVLRSQPTDILLFATEYFNKMIKLREETGYDGYTPKSQLQTDNTSITSTNTTNTTTTITTTTATNDNNDNNDNEIVINDNNNNNNDNNENNDNNDNNDNENVINGGIIQENVPTTTDSSNEVINEQPQYNSEIKGEPNIEHDEEITIDAQDLNAEVPNDGDNMENITEDNTEQLDNNNDDGDEDDEDKDDVDDTAKSDTAKSDTAKSDTDLVEETLEQTTPDLTDIDNEIKLDDDLEDADLMD